jgi:hypothetical protein
LSPLVGVELDVGEAGVVVDDRVGVEERLLALGGGILKALRPPIIVVAKARPDTVDVDVDGRFCICKSTTSRNEVGQLQRALGQLLHNRFKAERHDIDEVAAFLVAERQPANSDLWCDLCLEHGVVFTWPEKFDNDVPKPSSDG